MTTIELFRKCVRSLDTDDGVCEASYNAMYDLFVRKGQEGLVMWQLLSRNVEATDGMFYMVEMDGTEWADFWEEVSEMMDSPEED